MIFKFRYYFPRSYLSKLWCFWHGFIFFGLPYPLSKVTNGQITVIQILFNYLIYWTTRTKFHLIKTKLPRRQSFFGDSNDTCIKTVVHSPLGRSLKHKYIHLRDDVVSYHAVWQTVNLDMTSVLALYKNSLEIAQYCFIDYWDILIILRNSCCFILFFHTSNMSCKI